MHFAGRLGTYRYYNMDQAVAQALTLSARIVGQPRRVASRATGLAAPRELSAPARIARATITPVE